MNIYISVISHNHSQLINELSCIESLSDNFRVVVKSNCPGDDFHTLERKDNMYWIDSDYYLGFGENNNFVFEYCKNTLFMSDDDYFIVLNPDVNVSALTIKLLCDNMYDNYHYLAAINLFKDKSFTTYDNSIRTYPKLKDFILSFALGRNDTIVKKELINNPIDVDWAAGSFLAFKSSLYSLLSGFDEGFFMYCEDIDICRRSKALGFPVIFYPQFKALHFAQHSNKKILSRHFLWHVKSVIRYLLKQY
ncbi:glycosyltransferase family 2 protein [Vibrio vulnificus]|uniref:glycosyltransferase family 2 protein n=1 Tax=Vibrio vulnificus TaxID=672 RepID=UPI003EDAA1A6